MDTYPRTYAKLYRSDLRKVRKASPEISAVFGDIPGIHNLVQPQATRIGLRDYLNTNSWHIDQPIAAPLRSQALVQAAFEARKHQQLSMPQIRAVGRLLLPTAGIPVGNPQAEAAFGVKELRGCEMAEGGFVDCVHQVSDDIPITQPRISVYHTTDGVPLLLRKRKDESSALTLAHMTVGGVHVAPGTLVAVSTVVDPKPSSPGFQGKGYALETYGIGEVADLTPIRLTPWVYDDTDTQRAFSMTAAVYERGWAERIQSVSLMTIQASAVAIGERCGVQLANPAEL